MGRGDRDPPPPIEILGEDPAAQSVGVVTRGGQRPRRTRALAVGAGIALLLVGGLVLGDDDAPETDHAAPAAGGANGGADGTAADPQGTTTRPAPTPEVIAGAPLLGEPSGLKLVFTPSSRGLGGRLIDLDTGAITRIEVPVLGVIEQRLLVLDDGAIALWPAPYDGSGATTITTIPSDRFVQQAWTVDEGSRVWLLLEPPPDFFGQLPPEELQGAVPIPSRTARLVDLDGRTVAEVDIRSDLDPFGAVDRGVVVAGPGGIYVIEPSGAAQRISTGELVTVAHNRVVALSCDERLQCGTEVLDQQGRRLELHPITGPVPGGMGSGPGSVSGIVAVDGRVAAILDRTFESGAYEVEIDGGAPFQVAGIPIANPSWSTDGRWLVIPLEDRVHVLDTLGGAAPVDIPVGPTLEGYFFTLSSND